MTNKEMASSGSSQPCTPMGIWRCFKRRDIHVFIMEIHILIHSHVYPHLCSHTHTQHTCSSDYSSATHTHTHTHTQTHTHTHTHTHTSIHMCRRVWNDYVYTHMYHIDTYFYIFTPINSHSRTQTHTHPLHYVYWRVPMCMRRQYSHIAWLRSVGSLKLYVSFAKELYKRDHILQKRPVIWRNLRIEATA